MSEPGQRTCRACGRGRPDASFEPRRRVCRDCVNAARRRSGYRTYTSDRHRKYTFGLEPAEFAAMVRQAGGRCAICQQQSELCIDHDHRTGSIRGLLCDRCNRAIGHFRDSPGVCEAAADYLRGSR